MPEKKLADRLREAIRLRVKDIHFEYKTITVHDGKGEQDQVTMLSDSLITARCDRANVV